MDILQKSKKIVLLFFRFLALIKIIGSLLIDGKSYFTIWMIWRGNHFRYSVFSGFSKVDSIGWSMANYISLCRSCWVTKECVWSRLHLVCNNYCNVINF